VCNTHCPQSIQGSTLPSNTCSAHTTCSDSRGQKSTHSSKLSITDADDNILEHALPAGIRGVSEAIARVH
jgi:hypothetical protein